MLRSVSGTPGATGAAGAQGPQGEPGVIGGTIAITQVAVGSGADAIGGDATLVYGDAGGNLLGNDNALQLGPSRSLWMRAPDYQASPSGAEIFPDTRLAIDSSGSGGSLAIQNLFGTSGSGLNLYSQYTDDLNFTALHLGVDSISIWSLSAGGLVDTLLLIQGEGAQGVILADQSNLRGWGTGVVSGDHAWVPCGTDGSELPNFLDLGTPTNTVRTGYFGTSVVTPMLEGAEIATPSAPADGSGRTYFKAAGAGKTGLYVLFPSGAEQQLAVEA